MPKFGLVGKLFSKGDITGFFIVDNAGRQMLISKDKVIQLAETGNIANWRVAIDQDGEKHLVSDDLTLESLPNLLKDNISQLKLSSKLIKNGQVVGYSGVDETGKPQNISVDKLWELAKAGRVYGVQAMKDGDSRVLISEHQLLRELRETVIS